MKTGERLIAPRVDGHGGVYNWANKEAVFDKFKMLAGAVLKAAQVDAALNLIMSLEQAADVRKIVDTVIPPR